MVAVAESGIDTVAAVEQTSPGRGKLVAFLLGVAILQGAVVNLMPVMFSSMAATFHVDKAQQGMLKSCFFAGLMVSLVLSGYLTRYLGARLMTILAGIVAGAGAVCFGLAPSYTFVLVAASVLAMGIAPMTAVYAAVVAAHFPHTRQRMYMWIYGVLAGSAAIAQTALGALLDVTCYNPIFIGLGAMVWLWTLVVLAVGWRALGGPTKTAMPVYRANSRHSAFRQKLAALWQFLTSGIFTRGALYVMCLMMICDYLCVSNMLSWTPSFFEELYRGGNATGAMALSASSAGVCVGRLMMGALPTGKISERTLLALCYAGGVFSFGTILVMHPPYVGSIALMFLSGAFISAQAPTMGSLAVAKFGDRAPVVIPLYEAFGTIGGLVGPPLLGLLAMRAGELGAVMWMIPAAGLGLIALAVGWEICDRRRGVPELCVVPEVE